MDSLFPYRFEATIESHGVGNARMVWYSVIFLPAAIATTLVRPTQTPLRIRGEIDEIPVAGAWIPTGDGRRYFIVSRRLLRELGAGVGTRVEMRFAVDDPDRVDLPPELASAIAARAVLRRTWDALTPGRRRGLAHLVASAKRDATRQARVRQVVDEVLGRVPPRPRRRKPLPR